MTTGVSESRKLELVRPKNQIYFVILLLLFLAEQLADAEKAPVVPKVVPNVNKWDGEDEDDVKVSLNSPRAPIIAKIISESVGTSIE